MREHARARRLEAEDEDAVERDRQREEHREPARPAVDAVHARARDRNDALQLPEDARAGRDLHDRQDDRGRRKPRLPAIVEEKTDVTTSVYVDADACENTRIDADTKRYDRRVSRPSRDGRCGASSSCRTCSSSSSRRRSSRSRSCTSQGPGCERGAGQAGRPVRGQASSTDLRRLPRHERRRRRRPSPRRRTARVAAAKTQIDNGGGIMPAASSAAPARTTSSPTSRRSSRSRAPAIRDGW